MRILKIFSVLAFGSLLAAPYGFAQVSPVCSSLPDGGKPGFALQGDMWFPAGFEGDPFQCGIVSAQTPATCTLANRVWTDVESSCVNVEVGAPHDFIPYVWDNAATDFQRYETDIIAPSNFGGPLGKDTQAWYVVWDHMDAPLLDSCKGFYGAQSDILQAGETGSARVGVCKQGTLSLSCLRRLVQAEPLLCQPVNTVDGTVANIGALAAVPIPVISNLSAFDFSKDACAPGNLNQRTACLVNADCDLLVAGDGAGTCSTPSITLSWVPACQFQIQDAAPNPLMGYFVEVFVDGNGDGVCTPPAGCDADSGNFAPLAEIAPAAATGGGSGIAPVFIPGDRLSASATINFSQIPLPALATLATVDCVVFRNRIMFQDDRRNGGGIDLPISPVLSLPSGRSAVVQSQPLAALISDFAAGFGKAKSVNLAWRVGSDSFDTFRVSKSGDRNGTFQFVGEVQAVPGQLTYGLTDADALAGIEKTKGKPTVWYLLEASGIGGTETAGPIPVQRGKN